MVAFKAHRVIVVVIASRRAVIAEQGRNRLAAVCCVGQQADSLFIGLVGHHVGRGEVAIMAAQAEQECRQLPAAAGDEAVGRTST
jgi:hypothetical protein